VRQTVMSRCLAECQGFKNIQQGACEGDTSNGGISISAGKSIRAAFCSFPILTYEDAKTAAGTDSFVYVVVFLYCPSSMHAYVVQHDFLVTVVTSSNLASLTEQTRRKLLCFVCTTSAANAMKAPVSCAKAREYSLSRSPLEIFGCDSHKTMQ
jgi:hypothetical protein